MTELFVKILNMSITASYLIAVVLLIRILAKRIPRRYIGLLWILAAIRLVLPFELESAVSLIPSGRTVTKDIMTDYIPRIDSGIGTIDSSVNAAMANAGAVTTASANPMQVYMGILSVIWIAGIVVFLLLCVISYVRLDYRLVNAKPQQGRIYRCDEIATPFVLGIFKPKIYLPGSIGEEFDHVVAHEEAHIRRFDHVTKPLAYLILMLHWFNPLVWIGFIMYCRDLEMACDERVVRAMTVEERKEYASALLNCSAKQSVLSICPLAFGEIGVRSRISKVLHFNKPTKVILAVTATLIIVIAVCFMTSPASLKTTGIKLDANMEQAVVDGLLSEKYDGDGPIECSVEGHVVLGTEEKDAVTKVYAIVSTAKYGFFDDRFLEKGDLTETPAVIYLTKNKGKYHFQKIEYPDGGTAYERALKEIFQKEKRMSHQPRNGAKHDFLNA